MIIQAPMAGVTTPQFVVASCEAGALGSLGAGYMSESETASMIYQIREKTTKPFAVNLFVPEKKTCTNVEAARAYAKIRTYEKRLGLDEQPLNHPKEAYDEQCALCIRERVPYVSFTFGLPSRETVIAMKTKGIRLIGTATSKKEAEAVEARGLDYVVLQSIEAGGHRGSFIEEGQTDWRTLLEETSHLFIPRIVAGSIATTDDVKEAYEKGAAGVQVGTALLCATESGASLVHQQALRQSKRGDTTLTKAFSGKWARGIRNTFIDEMKDATIAPYPYQNEWTKRLRKEATRQGNASFVSLWSGTKGYLAEERSVGDILAPFVTLAQFYKKNT